jgi:hypothetical protein
MKPVHFTPSVLQPHAELGAKAIESEGEARRSYIVRSPIASCTIWNETDERTMICGSEGTVRCLTSC